MNNQKSCFFCKHRAMKLMPIKNKQGYVIATHNICRTCNKDQTQYSLKKRKYTLSSKKNIKSTKRKSRVLKGYAVGLVSLALTFSALTTLANYDTSVVYTASSTPQIAPVSHKTAITATKPSKTIKDKIEHYAALYGVNPIELENIVKCETGSKDVNQASTTIQSNYLKGTPRRELSFGVSQIHISAHGITREQAYDVDYSLDFLASHWAKGHQAMWLNCSKKFGYI